MNFQVMGSIETNLESQVFIIDRYPAGVGFVSRTKDPIPVFEVFKRLDYLLTGSVGATLNNFVKSESSEIALAIAHRERPLWDPKYP